MSHARRARRTLAPVAAGIAVALAVGVGAPAGTAHADALDDVFAQYDTGAGGGQVSNLIHSIMKLRQQGYKPSRNNLADVTAALDKRPNQVPLVAALRDTLAYQKHEQALTQLAQGQQQTQLRQLGGGGYNNLPPGSPGASSPAPDAALPTP